MLRAGPNRPGAGSVPWPGAQGPGLGRPVPGVGHRVRPQRRPISSHSGLASVISPVVASTSTRQSWPDAGLMSNS